MAAFVGNAILTPPQGRNALTVTQMYLTIMENPLARWRVMHCKQKSYSGGPKLISPRAARKMNSQQQQSFKIIYMKPPQNNRTGVTLKTEEFSFFPSTNDTEIFCVRILLKLHVSWRKTIQLYPFLFPPLPCGGIASSSGGSMKMVKLLHK